MLLAQNITLERSNRTIFKNVSLSLASGKIIIIRGKNGSGKTTLIKTILNILEPSSGNIYWKGKLLKKSINDYYNNITYISDNTTSIRELSVHENIKIWKKIFLSNVSELQINNILYTLGLNNYSKVKVSALSLGEIKKLELIRLIIENKKYWILDEPLSNLDLETINMVGQTFIDHSKNGGAIIFSSHQNIQVTTSEEIDL